MKLLSTLYPFQQADLEQLERWGGNGMLGSEVGTGKTLVALAYIARNPKCLPVVITVPAHLKLNWQRLAKQHIGVDIPILSGTRANWGEVKGQQAVILNHDILHAWVWQLQQLKPNLVIADEAHAFGGETSRRTWALRELLKGVKHFIPISGTPISIRPIEFWPLLNMLDSEQWPNRHAFGHRFCKARRNPWSQGWDYKGCSRPDELHRILTNPIGGYLIRRLKKGVLKDLPEKVHNVVPLRLSASAMKKYRAARSDVRNWLKTNYGGGTKNKGEALERVNDLRQLTADLKLPAVIEWVKGFLDSGEKLLCFGVHRRFVTGVQDAFSKQSVMVHGGVPDTQRQERFDAFNHEKRIVLLSGNIEAAGTGWSCTSTSNVAIAELPWRPSSVTQATGRIDGIGRGIKGVSACTNYLLAEGTFDEGMCESLRDKERNVGRVLDGECWNDNGGDVFDSVVQELMRET